MRKSAWFGYSDCNEMRKSDEIAELLTGFGLVKAWRECGD